MTTFEDMPSVQGHPAEYGSIIRGDIRATSNVSSDELTRRFKYLILSLAENPVARQLATKYEVAFHESNAGVLDYSGHQQDRIDFIVACWHEPSLRSLFNVLELDVAL